VRVEIIAALSNAAPGRPPGAAFKRSPVLHRVTTSRHSDLHVVCRRATSDAAHIASWIVVRPKVPGSSAMRHAKFDQMSWTEEKVWRREAVRAPGRPTSANPVEPTRSQQSPKAYPRRRNSWRRVLTSHPVNRPGPRSHRLRPVTCHSHACSASTEASDHRNARPSCHAANRAEPLISARLQPRLCSVHGKAHHREVQVSQALVCNPSQCRRPRSR
jgi:hypothetical protein